jgi:hypothetical protein
MATTTIQIAAMLKLQMYKVPQLKVSFGQKGKNSLVSDSFKVCGKIISTKLAQG